jgi:hypothetical protein
MIKLSSVVRTAIVEAVELELLVQLESFGVEPRELSVREVAGCRGHLRRAMDVILNSHKLIEATEDAIDSRCDECGAPATYEAAGYYGPLCDRCAEEQYPGCGEYIKEQQP